MFALVQQYIGGAGSGCWRNCWVCRASPCAWPSCARRYSAWSTASTAWRAAAPERSTPSPTWRAPRPRSAWPHRRGQAEDGRRLLGGEGVPARLLHRSAYRPAGPTPRAGPAGQGLPVTELLDGAILAAVDALLQEAQRGSTPTFDALELPAGAADRPGLARSAGAWPPWTSPNWPGQGAAVAGVLDAELAAPTHNPDEIERLVNGARALLEAAILLRRTLFTVEPALHVIQPLRSSAALMQAQAQTYPAASAAGVRRAVESGGNLRLIAHRWYADHRRAPELLRLNPTCARPTSCRPAKCSMPTRADIRLSIGGQAHETWDGWSVESDLLTPADAFELELFTRDRVSLPASFRRVRPAS
ncbi:hypothetical protein P4233_30970 [Pseudomonas aeruginosa]|nr:hypothetical protein [Pseudomonas aeruginosa]